VADGLNVWGVVAGPALAGGAELRWEAGAGAVTLGRSASAGVVLADPTVSRQHAVVEERGGRWRLRDAGSRHGTTVNGLRLEADQPVELRLGDRVKIGPWTFVVGGAGALAGRTIITESTASTDRVEAVPERELRRLAEHRLDVLLQCSAAVNAAQDGGTVAAQITRAARDGARARRALLVRPLGESGHAEVLGFAGSAGEAAEAASLSRSLLAAAAEGKTARVSAEDSAASYGQSIALLDIHSAVCSPVVVGESVEALLYLDARGGERTLEDDAAAFCQAVARICGLALANVRRREMQAQWAELERDLEAARAAQRLLMPAPAGSVGGLSYAVRSIPGRFVAGDLFDVVLMDGGRVGVFLGDVSGKGAGAAITMAVAQSQMRTALVRTGDPAAAVGEVNRLLAGRLPSGQFVTLFCAVIDSARAVMRVVDAGHGLAMLRSEGRGARLIETRGMIPLGLDASAIPVAEEVACEGACRLVVFSDGVAEQPDAEGRAFGLEAVAEALAGSSDAGADVEAIVAAVARHAGGERFNDDLTVASVGG
jgi:serine phosphatase RsbU (regulator of sigma subunit)